MADVDYLSVEDVEELHALAIEMYGGLPGRDPGNLEAKLALPYSGFGDYERYPTLIEKAAVYHYHLASGHCFKDGNKRTSYLSAKAFLNLNGFNLVVPDEEIFSWTKILADDKERPKFEKAVEWIDYYIVELIE
ncbi:type II toxin-antitoxin system death-on-curing family toxin [Salipaludibacillus daqingensis]|uniref:type II toxin-antitoxin system death-on-curing family toxin n=1 Tax=Salipaludibacillus daqingensis TaxID=3041001 RepID=UPI002474D590|nr:type II toxin-antitoxin system death-on-curing family toxin [Salipaludibacillus daqingensis]